MILSLYLEEKLELGWVTVTFRDLQMEGNPHQILSQKP